MGRGASINTFKRDSLVLEFMKNHKGEENIVSSQDIYKFLNDNGWKIARHSVGAIISKIMYDFNAPICYTNGKGYYWATRKAEIERTINDMELRRASLQEHINHLKNFIIK